MNCSKSLCRNYLPMKENNKEVPCINWDIMKMWFVWALLDINLPSDWSNRNSMMDLITESEAVRKSQKIWNKIISILVGLLKYVLLLGTMAPE